MGSKRLSKADFLDTQDLSFEDVEVPVLGGIVRITELSVKALSDFYNSFPQDEAGKQTAKLEQFREKLLAWTIVDESGNRLFSDDDIPAIGKKSLKVVKQLFAVAQKLNGMDAAKEAIEKK